MKKLPAPTEPSEEFLGLYVHGGHKPFVLHEHEVAFASFRKFSKKLYPIWFFYAEEPDHDDAGMKEIANRYSPVHVIEIPVLGGMHEYSKFMIWKVFQMLPEKYEKVLTFQSDGFLRNPGWEDWINEHDPDYVGAPWDYKWGGHPDPEVILPPEMMEKFQFPEGEKLEVGNGGFSFRKRSKMLEVAEAIKEEEIVWEGGYCQYGVNAHCAMEDGIICQVGFSTGILKPISPDLAREFSVDPYRDGRSIGFHAFI